MSRKRIVFATHGTLGDLHPYLAIALELQHRGHQPLIATSQYHRAKIEAAGIEFHPLRPDYSLDDKDLHRRLTEPKRGMERIIREFMLPALRDTYDDLLSAVQKDGGADLLVSQILIFAAPLIAEKTGVRWVSTELQPGAFMSGYDPPVMAPAPWLDKLRGLGPTFHRPLFSVAKQQARLWARPINQLRRELNLRHENQPLFAGRHSPRLVLALFSRVFAEPQPDWPSNTQVTGFPFYDENETKLDPELERFLEAGEPPIVFTLGSSAVWDAGNFFEESVGAAKLLGKRAVLLLGSDPLNQPREPLPKDLLAVAYVTYPQIFPHASVIVHQGGIGTTGQALRAGKPMLIMPFGGDQFDNGARVARLGAGRTIMRRQYLAQRVAAELDQLLSNPGYCERATELSRCIQSEDGVRTACDAIEKQMAG
ncbi:MAG TPA: glycosyltransferase [Pyrinomonadaceae bacterium]|nr:glycosyltransferase [Pyrinomonadaceae bacterium]